MDLFWDNSNLFEGHGEQQDLGDGDAFDELIDNLRDRSLLRLTALRYRREWGLRRKLSRDEVIKKFKRMQAHELIDIHEKLRSSSLRPADEQASAHDDMTFIRELVSRKQWEAFHAFSVTILNRKLNERTKKRLVRMGAKGLDRVMKYLFKGKLREERRLVRTHKKVVRKASAGTKGEPVKRKDEEADFDDTASQVLDGDGDQQQVESGHERNAERSEAVMSDVQSGRSKKVALCDASSGGKTKKRKHKHNHEVGNGACAGQEYPQSEYDVRNDVNQSSKRRKKHKQRSSTKADDSNVQEQKEVEKSVDDKQDAFPMLGEPEHSLTRSKLGPDQRNVPSRSDRGLDLKKSKRKRRSRVKKSKRKHRSRVEKHKQAVPQLNSCTKDDCEPDGHRAQASATDESSVDTASAYRHLPKTPAEAQTERTPRPTKGKMSLSDGRTNIEHPNIEGPKIMEPSDSYNSFRGLEVPQSPDVPECLPHSKGYGSYSTENTSQSGLESADIGNVGAVNDYSLRNKGNHPFRVQELGLRSESRSARVHSPLGSRSIWTPECSDAEVYREKPSPFVKGGLLNFCPRRSSRTGTGKLDSYSSLLDDQLRLSDHGQSAENSGNIKQRVPQSPAIEPQNPEDQTCRKGTLEHTRNEKRSMHSSIPVRKQDSSDSSDVESSDTGSSTAHKNSSISAGTPLTAPTSIPSPVAQVSPKTKRKATGMKSSFFKTAAKPVSLHSDRTKLAQIANEQTCPSNKSNIKRTPGTSCIAMPPLTNKSFGLVQEILCDQPLHLLIATMLLNQTTGRAAVPKLFELLAQFPTAETLARAKIEDLLSIIGSLGLQWIRAARIISLANVWLQEPPIRIRRYRVLHYPRSGDGLDIKPGEILGPEEDDPRIAWEVANLPGIGPYGIDSWRIFCRDELRGLADDWNGKNAKPTKLGMIQRKDKMEAGAVEKELEVPFEPEWKRVLPQDKELRAFLRWMWLKEGYEWDPETGQRHKASQETLDRVNRGAEEVEVTGKAGLVGSVCSPDPARSAMQAVNPAEKRIAQAIERGDFATVKEQQRKELSQTENKPIPAMVREREGPLRQNNKEKEDPLRLPLPTNERNSVLCERRVEKRRVQDLPSPMTNKIKSSAQQVKQVQPESPSVESRARRTGNTCFSGKKSDQPVTQFQSMNSPSIPKAVEGLTEVASSVNKVSARRLSSPSPSDLSDISSIYESCEEIISRSQSPKNSVKTKHAEVNSSLPEPDTHKTRTLTPTPYKHHATSMNTTTPSFSTKHKSFRHQDLVPADKAQQVARQQPETTHEYPTKFDNEIEKGMAEARRLAKLALYQKPKALMSAEDDAMNGSECHSKSPSKKEPPRGRIAVCVSTRDRDRSVPRSTVDKAAADRRSKSVGAVRSAKLIDNMRSMTPPVEARASSGDCRSTGKLKPTAKMQRSRREADEAASIRRRVQGRF